MKRIKIMLLMITLFLFVTSTSALAWEWSVGANVSTLGGGVSLEKQFSEHFVGRVGVNYFYYSYSGTESQIKYDFDLTLKNAAILGDFHPFAGNFRITAGILINGNEIKGKAKGQGTYEIGDMVYTAAQIGELKGKIDFNTIAPYLGLGWDFGFKKEKGFTFTFDVGVVYQGKPDVDLKVNGPIATNALFQQELSKEESRVEDSIDEYRYYPVVTIGITYKF
jgi:hypothetical protein